MTKRNFSITKKDNNTWYHAKVTDSYGNEYSNWFETAEKASDWLYYVWEKEDWFNSQKSQDLLADAIANCIELDKKRGIEPSLD